MKGHLSENRDYRPFCSKGVSYHHLHFGRGSKAVRKNGKALQWGKKEGFRCALIGTVSMGSCRQADQASYVTGAGCIPGFLWLILCRKQGQKLGKLLFINQVLVIWG